MKVGDKVRVRGGRKVCRVSLVEDPESWPAAQRACATGWLTLAGLFADHFGEWAHKGRGGHRFPLCKTCWPDGDGEEVKGG